MGRPRKAVIRFQEVAEQSVHAPPLTRAESHNQRQAGECTVMCRQRVTCGFGTPPGYGYRMSGQHLDVLGGAHVRKDLGPD
jgi:hypothetical protein